ncbi:DJ-1/PfpI family protein [Stackebrandtia albiflava]|uniref:DJ-1/PfpI family protein n=1 Tax=Stackebrandtia albiflava TaxID=406432 RepID=A0A562UPL6_9ACTN|nr:DJ-1/PfpI family protein [Stackebrandtia albiflava]TWJ07558.1 DJ-1/PfpI family protein [Stackebrandtia albiflava]
MRVEILMYDGVSEVDAIMALHVFQVAARLDAPVTARLVTADGATEVTGADHTRVTGLAEWSPDEADVLLVSGGWIHEVIADGELIERLARFRDPAAPRPILTGVCAGAVLLGAAGLLEGRPATTHHPAFPDLAAYAEVVDARIVDAGDVITAGGGPLSGFDLPLYLLERELGLSRTAARVEQFMEYDRRGTVWR